MLILLSPAKTLDYQQPAPLKEHSQPDYLKRAQQLVNILKKYTPHGLSNLMNISDKLALENAERFSSWHFPFTVENSKQALFAFMGDVYEGIDALSLSKTEWLYMQQHIRILSGLYGILRPLDLMQPYRLEMGTKLLSPYGKNLYEFWGSELTYGLNKLLNDEDKVINLASEEYFKVIKVKELKGQIITPVFEDYKNGQYKIISFYAKRARGLMARFALTGGVENLKYFNEEGYHFAPEVSTDTKWVFRRKIDT